MSVCVIPIIIPLKSLYNPCIKFLNSNPAKVHGTSPCNPGLCPATSGAEQLHGWNAARAPQTYDSQEIGIKGPHSAIQEKWLDVIKFVVRFKFR